jgi:hypothetical protein
VNATNGRTGGLGVGFSYWRPQGGKLSTSVECLRRQRERGDQDVVDLQPQIAIVVKKHEIVNISRKEGRLVARDQEIVENNRKRQKIIMELK